MAISNISLVNSPFTNPTKGSSRPSNPDTRYIGIITRIVNSQVIIKIPKLNSSAEFGPCDVYCEFPVVGEKVICGYIDGRFEHIVVFGKQNLGPALDDSQLIKNQVFRSQ